MHLAFVFRARCLLGPLLAGTAASGDRCLLGPFLMGPLPIEPLLAGSLSAVRREARCAPVGSTWAPMPASAVFLGGFSGFPSAGRAFPVFWSFAIRA